MKNIKSVDVCIYCLYKRGKHNLIKCCGCGKRHCYKCLVDIDKDDKYLPDDERRKYCISCLIENTKLVKDKARLIITKSEW